MARTIFIGPSMYKGREKTEVKWCSCVRRPLTAPEISKERLDYFYEEIRSATVNQGATNRTVRCRAKPCKGDVKTATSAFYFLEVTKDVFAGPLCTACLTGHIRSMARNSGETEDIPIYRVVTTPKAVDRILKQQGASQAPTRNVGHVKQSIRMF